MSNILSPRLYELLDERVPGGVVRVVSPGYELLADYQVDLDGHYSLHVLASGEEYVCRCPFCDDRSVHGHLYINHRYGSYDRVSGSALFHLAKCFRSDCLSDAENRKQLARMILRNAVDSKIGSLPAPNAGKPIPVNPTELRPIEPPGRLIPVNQLAETHLARHYLQVQRQQNIDELVEKWSIAYCVPPCREPQAEGRIFIPITMNGDLVSWQARYPGDIDWKKTGVRKYLNQKWMPKRMLLYNYDLARTQPLVCLVEGVTDVWKLGAASVALLGKTITQQQIDLLQSAFADKPVVILLDGDDPDAIRASQSVEVKLNRALSSPVVRVSMPVGFDPGDCQRTDLWPFIIDSAKAQGIHLPEPDYD